MKKILVAVALVSALAATAASAASYEGKWGVSLANSSFPVGVTFGLGKTAAVDLGVGFSSSKSGVEGASSLSNFGVEAGVRGALMQTENANLFVRGFGSYYSAANYGSSFVRNATGDTPKLNTMKFGAQLGFEWWPASIVSVYARHGIAYTSQKSNADGAVAATSFGLEGETLGQAGFCLWFGGK